MVRNHIRFLLLHNVLPQTQQLKESAFIISPFLGGRHPRMLRPLHTWQRHLARMCVEAAISAEAQASLPNHLGCWQNSAPCSHIVSSPFLCWLSTGGGSQFPGDTSGPPHLALSQRQLTFSKPAGACLPGWLPLSVI